MQISTDKAEPICFYVMHGSHELFIAPTRKGNRKSCPSVLFDQSVELVTGVP